MHGDPVNVRSVGAAVFRARPCHCGSSPVVLRAGLGTDGVDGFGRYIRRPGGVNRTMSVGVGVGAGFRLDSHECVKRPSPGRRTNVDDFGAQKILEGSSRRKRSMNTVSFRKAGSRMCLLGK